MSHQRIFLLHALAPLHVGVDAGVGAIDLPTMREAHTGYPVIPGSSVKGVLREEAEIRTGREAEEVLAAFGPPQNLSGDSRGGAVFTDAQLLALPVRSLCGTFAWVSCEFALGRLARDLATAGYPELERPPRLTATADASLAPARSGQAKPLLSVETVENGKHRVFLEDLVIEAAEDPAVAALAETLAEWLWPGDDGALDRELFRDRFLLVHDDVFAFLTQLAMEVRARVQLDSESGTVAVGPWSEEHLPTESILHGLVMGRKTKRGEVSWSEARCLAVVAGLLAADPVLRFGGHSSVGLGRARVRLLAEEARRVGSEARHERGPADAVPGPARGRKAGQGSSQGGRQAFGRAGAGEEPSHHAPPPRSDPGAALPWEGRWRPRAGQMAPRRNRCHPARGRRPGPQELPRLPGQDDPRLLLPSLAERRRGRRLDEAPDRGAVPAEAIGRGTGRCLTAAGWPSPSSSPAGRTGALGSLGRGGLAGAATRPRGRLARPGGGPGSGARSAGPERRRGRPEATRSASGSTRWRSRPSAPGRRRRTTRRPSPPTGRSSPAGVAASTPTSRGSFGRWSRSRRAAGSSLHPATHETVTEGSVLLHHPYGVPYLPGSGLKGVLRHRLERDHPAETGKEKAGLADELLGRQDRKLGDLASVVDLLDALWVPERPPDLSPEWSPLALDVVTPHHPKYYTASSGERQPPTDYDEPKPVHRLTVAPGARFLLVAEVADTPGARDWLAELVDAYLLPALEEDGFGAWTSVGYGRLAAVGGSGTPARRGDVGATGIRSRRRPRPPGTRPWCCAIRATESSRPPSRTAVRHWRPEPPRPSFSRVCRQRFRGGFEARRRMRGSRSRWRSSGRAGRWWA